MAMDGTTLGTAMADATKAIYTLFDKTTEVSQAQLDSIFIALGQEIVNHVTSQGVTSTTVTTGSSAGTFTGTIS